MRLQLSNFTFPLRRASWSQMYASSLTSNDLWRLPFLPVTWSEASALRMRPIELGLLMEKTGDPYHERNMPTRVPLEMAYHLSAGEMPWRGDFIFRLLVSPLELRK